MWPLLGRSAWDQPVTVVAGTTGEGAALASVLSVSVGSGCPCFIDTTNEGADWSHV
jgi:hypothetical protein